MKGDNTKITIDDFAKVDIRLGKVLEATEVEGSEKLIRQVVDFGPEVGKRIIFSGIKKWYMPEDLIGKLLPYLINIEPRKMMGEDSQGMLVAATSEKEGKESAVLLMPISDVSPGSKII